MKRLFYVLCVSITLLLVPSSCADCMDEIKDTYRQEVELKTELINKYLYKDRQAYIDIFTCGRKLSYGVHAYEVRIDGDYVYWGEHFVFKVADWLMATIEGGHYVFYFKG